jgi:hypothetical protein
MGVHYTTSVGDIDATMLDGFFEGWRSLPSPAKHLRILRLGREWREKRQRERSRQDVTVEALVLHRGPPPDIGFGLMVQPRRTDSDPRTTAIAGLRCDAL